MEGVFNFFISKMPSHVRIWKDCDNFIWGYWVLMIFQNKFGKHLSAAFLKIGKRKLILQGLFSLKQVVSSLSFYDHWLKSIIWVRYGFPGDTDIFYVLQFHCYKVLSQNLAPQVSLQLEINFSQSFLCKHSGQWATSSGTYNSECK